MALVRVYCGLASAGQTPPDGGGEWLTVAVVDDSGRLLDICDITDDAAGYAQLGTVLAERAAGPTGVAVAADSDDHLVTMLLTAAGRLLTFADDDAVNDFAERFSDDDSVEEIESPHAERRAIGLARALQAGVLSAVALPAPREMAALKPVLGAHAAVVAGRQAAAVALREVLRELYPAALRAYPDPAEPVPLAILDALPEPGLVNGATANRARDAAGAAEAIVNQLAATGVADAATIAAAITSLRVAVAETPRRTGVSKTFTTAVASTVRDAVAAVRAFDAAGAALIGALAERANPRAVTGGSRTRQRLAPAKGMSTAGLRAVREATAEQAAVQVPAQRRGRGAPVPVSVPPAAVAATPLGHAAMPVPMPPAPAPMPAPMPAAMPVPMPPAPAPMPAAMPVPMPPAPAPMPAAMPVPMPPTPAPMPATLADQLAPGVPSMPPAPTTSRPGFAPAAAASTPPTDPHRTGTVPPPPPGMTPMAPAPVSPAPRPVSPAPPFRTTVTITPSPSGDPGPAQQPAPLGSRSNWPLVSGADDLSSEPVMANLAPDPILGDPYAGSPPRHNGTPVNGVASLDSGRPVDIGAPADPSRRPVERVTPPWQADDLPPEPPTLRLVEPPPLPDPALTGFGDVLGGGDQHLGSRPLRLVEEAGPDRDGRNPTRSGARPGPAPVAVPPVADDDSDADLLIFAAARSAWFTGQESEEGWGVADAGWRAAEQAARPSIGTPTNAGLPKRVPQANLVPGSALNEAERPLRIVRDAASIAEHTSGYFQGWRRGQQIGGYAVGGRPGRESAQGWDFSRDPGDHEYDEESPYRAAGGHRSR